VLDHEVQRPADVGEALGQVEVHQLVAEPGRRVLGDQQRPALRGQPDLLGQLPAGGVQGRLAVGVTEPGRQLPEPVAHRVPVLAQQHDLVVVVHRDDADRAGVVHDLPDALRAAGHGHGVTAQRDHPAGVHLLAGEDLELVRRRVVRNGHQMPISTSSGTGSRAASW
jgi:hypothetical protein